MTPESRLLFPTYLLPSPQYPTRRRHSSSTTSETHEHAVPYLSHSPSSSTDSSPSLSPTSSPPLPSAHLLSLLHAALQSAAATQSNSETRTERLRTTLPNILRCGTCAVDIAFASQIVSKGFTGRHGRAYLVGPLERHPQGERAGLLNIRVGRSVTRELLTGTHVVADVSCTICTTILGWKYVDAREQTQMYKIGKYILETKRIVACSSWEDSFVIAHEEEQENISEGNVADDVVVFDSEDEDECEDLFAGVWDAAVVKKRRARRLARKQAASEP